MQFTKPSFKKILSEKWNKYLFLLILFHIFFFVVFRVLNKSYQTWDSAGHIGLSYRMADEIKRFASSTEGSSFSTIMKVSNYYPPFVQLIGSFISLLFGYESIFLLTETLIFFIISIIFTYKLAFLLTKNEKLSFLSATIYSLFPQIVDQSHYFHLDVPLTALILICVYYLLISDNFKKVWPTILFFIFFSFIQLTKWTGFVFLIVPVVLTLYKAFISKDAVSDRSDKIKIILNLLIGSLIFLILVIPWYYVNWNELIAQVKVFSGGESDDPTNLWQSLVYYPSNAISHQIMFLPFILIVLSLIRFLKNNRKNFIIILLTILVPWLLFVLISNKNLRYTLPLTPLLAYLISDLLINVFENKKTKLKYFTSFTIIYLMVASLLLSFVRLEKESPILKPISIFFTGPRYSAWYYYGTSFYAYKSYRYPVDDVLSYIYEDANEREKGFGVAVLVDSEEMSAAMLEVVRMELGYKNMYMPVPYFQFDLFESIDRIEAFFYETGSKYVITSTNIGPGGLRNYLALNQVTEYLNDTDSMFEKINEFKVFKDDDKSPFNLSPSETISIYKIKPSFYREETSVDGCRFGAGIEDGIETIKLSKNHTYVFYTGHFAIQDKVWKAYEKGVMYVVQIENTIHESMLDVHNLPKSGSSFCSIGGLNLDFSKEIKDALTLEDQCGQGVKCHKVVHVKWSVGEPTVDITEYTADSIN